MKTRLGLVEGECKDFQSLVVMLGGENRQVSVEDLDDKFGNIRGFSFFLLWLLDQQRQHSIEGLYELPWIQ